MGSTPRCRKTPKQRCRSTPPEIEPKGWTNFHCHNGATFFIALQGIFEAHFEEGVLIRAKAGDVYSEPIGKMHRGHNPHDTIPYLCVAFCVTARGPRPRNQRRSGFLRPRAASASLVPDEDQHHENRGWRESGVADEQAEQRDQPSLPETSAALRRPPRAGRNARSPGPAVARRPGRGCSRSRPR